MLLKKIWHMLPQNVRYWYGARKTAKSDYKRIVDKCIKKFDFQHPPIFKAIEIETINRCNGKCSFCPVNVNEPQREYAKMSRELFEKIITDLKKINYDGKISLFSNNEPFLDERIIEFHKIVRRELPKAYISLFTNGSMLNINNISEIYSYIDKMIIDNYDESNLPMNLQEVEIWCKEKDVDGKIYIVPRKREEILTSRGGQAPNKKNVSGVKVRCLYPYQQMVVRPTGLVSLCCNDALGKYTLGDLNSSSVEEVWNSELYKEVRLKMKQGRSKLQLCNSCDTRNLVYRDEGWIEK